MTDANAVSKYGLPEFKMSAELKVDRPADTPLAANETHRILQDIYFACKARDTKVIDDCFVSFFEHLHDKVEPTWPALAIADWSLQHIKKTIKGSQEQFDAYTPSKGYYAPELFTWIQESIPIWLPGSFSEQVAKTFEPFGSGIVIATEWKRRKGPLMPLHLVAAKWREAYQKFATANEKAVNEEPKEKKKEPVEPVTK